MEHVVFFPAPDGTPAFRRLAGLDEAVRLVEHLRNVEGVSSASVHALTEVPLAFRAYYRVELPSAVDVPAVGVPAQADAPPVEAAAPVEGTAAVAASEPVPVLALVEEPAVEPEPAMSAGNGHATPTSLGFFA